MYNAFQQLILLFSVFLKVLQCIGVVQEKGTVFWNSKWITRNGDRQKS